MARVGFNTCVLSIFVLSLGVAAAAVEEWSGKAVGLAQPRMYVGAWGASSCSDVPELRSELGSNPEQGLQARATWYANGMQNSGDGRGNAGSTGPKTCTTAPAVPRAPHNTNGLCGSRYCNGENPSQYGVALGKFNEASGGTCTDHPSCNMHTQRRTGQCYRDNDCQFYNKDSQGHISGEVVGTCERVSDTLSVCRCMEPYFGVNCEYKKCPEARATAFMCNGVQGEGMDYYGPYNLNNRSTDGGHTLSSQSPAEMQSGLLNTKEKTQIAQRRSGPTQEYMGSEWNQYDQILEVDNHIQSYLSTSGYTVSYSQLHRGPHKVGGVCDFEVGKCKCHPTYYGAACDQRTCPMGFGHDQLVKTACSGQGDCVREQAGQEFVCKCHSNFFGLDCSMRHCPNSTRGFICDNHGSCDTANGFCKCDKDHYGPDCSWKKCPRVNGRVCNGQGVCYASSHNGMIGTMSEGNFTDYEGKKHNAAPVNCDTPKGVVVEGRMPDSSSGNPCSNMYGGWQSGQQYGKCACRWPYFGEDCSLKMCPNSTYTDSGSGLTCDGHGACNFKTGLCTCQTGYFGHDCHQRTCPFSNKNQQRMLLECNGEGVCDRTWGRCICIGDIEGTFLGQVTNSQPFGNDPFTHSQGDSKSRYPSGVHPQWSRGEVGGASADSAGRSGGSSSDSNGFHQNFPGSSGGASSNKGYTTTGLHRPGEQHNTHLGHFNPTLPNGRITGFFGGQRFFATVAQLAPSYGWATKHMGEHSHIRLNHRYWGKSCERLHCPSYPDIQTFKPLRTLHTEHSHNADGYRPYPNECSGPLQGDCDTTTGKCVCKAGWYGKDCAQRGKGDGTANRRLHFNYDPEKKLRPDGTLKDREGWTFSGEGTSTPQVDY